MARIRTIKPEFFRHVRLYRAEVASGLPLRVAFAGLWTACDREGRFLWEPEALKLDCLPYDAVDFGAVLNALADGGFIIAYEVDGRMFGYVPSFPRHQVINNREMPSAFPAPDVSAVEAASSTREARVGHASATREARVFDLVQGKGREGNGKEGKEYSSALPSSAEPEAPAILTFPTNGPVKHWSLTQAHVDEWAPAYAGLDVLTECRKALVWVSASPDRKKTAKGMPKFLVGWLGRANDRGRPGPGPVKMDIYEAFAAEHAEGSR